MQNSTDKVRTGKGGVNGRGLFQKDKAELLLVNTFQYQQGRQNVVKTSPNRLSGESVILNADD